MLIIVPVPEHSPRVDHRRALLPPKMQAGIKKQASTA